MALSKQEMQRLRYIETHQKQIRADLYQNLHDAVEAHDQSQGQLRAGTRVVLPATFSGGRRNMHKRYQDAMAVVRKKGALPRAIEPSLCFAPRAKAETLETAATQLQVPLSGARVLCTEHACKVPLSRARLDSTQHAPKDGEYSMRVSHNARANVRPCERSLKHINAVDLTLRPAMLYRPKLCERKSRSQ